MAKKERTNFKNGPYESFVTNICGDTFSSYASLEERDGAIGIAIVKTILDGHAIRNKDVAKHLGLSPDDIFYAYKRIRDNGLLRNDGEVIRNDKGLRDNDMHTWCTYAGYASGFTRRLA